MARTAQKHDVFRGERVRHPGPFRAGRRLSALLLAALFCRATAFSEVVTAPLASHPEWGYTVSGLGEGGDETAVVFTNHAEAATWTVPTYLTNVQFLVVGGGGGAGAGTSGPGGGGGGVVTGLVHSLTKNAVVRATVGAGGTGGSSNAGAGTVGTSSSFEVDGVRFVTANRGGRGGSNSSPTGGSGGSGAGGRSSSAGGAATKGSVGEGASACLHGVEMFGNAGGDAYKDGTFSAAGGGGGATEAGGNATSTKLCGNGGEGLACDITGTGRVYGSGGGGGTSTSGGTPGKGGTGAGDGHSNKNAVANQGGGGGGGAGYANAGGAGGSGIVVFRYRLAANIAIAPTIAPKPYAGTAQAADVADGNGYTVTENDGGVDVGTYDVVLATDDGYVWDTTGASGAITLPFSITFVTNVWTTEPSISKSSWTGGVDEPGVLTNGVTRFGAVAATIAKDGGDAAAFGGTLPTEAGEYVVAYAAPAATANYAAPETPVKTVSFAIFAADAIPPYQIALGTLSADTNRTLSIPYSLSCDVTTPKVASLYARYALDGATTTNTAQIAAGVALGGGAGTGTVADLMPGTNYWVDVYAVVDAEPSSPTALASVAVPGPSTDFSASATFTNDPMEFVLSGSLAPGLGTTTVTVSWSVSTNTLENSATFVFQQGDPAAFATNIAYAALGDTITWKVDVVTTYTSATYGTQTWTDSTGVATKSRRDAAAVTYAWTGEGGDNLWTNIANWSASRAENFGYPNSTYATARFETAGAVADLGGRTFNVRDGGLGLAFASGLGEVTLRNGTINMNSAGSDLSFGAGGTTVVLDSVNLVGFHGLKFAANSPMVFSGTSTQSWSYEPWGVNGTELVVRDGTMESGFFQAWFSSDRVHNVAISNAVWTIRSAANPVSLGNVVTFRDGENRQGRVVSLGKIKLGYTYDIAIPAQGHDTATLTAATLDAASTSCTFALDVTGFSRAAKVPVVAFTGADQSSVVAAVPKTLRAYANGVNVTGRRNARLVWSSEDNTLYYQQDAACGLVTVIR